MKKSLHTIVQTILLNGADIRTYLKVLAARINGKKLIFVLGTPIHRNIGDLAITIAEDKFISSSLNAEYINITMPQMMESRHDIMRHLIRPGDVLMGHGGGNMGEAYMVEEECRRKFIKQFPNNKIIIFPQTIYFSESKLAGQELKKTKTIYAAHKDLTLIAREQRSYDTMKANFSKNTVILTPDIVLSMEETSPIRPRDGLLICLRDDKEAKISDEEKEQITKYSRENFKRQKNTDTVSHDSFFIMRSKRGVVRRKLTEFKSAELVITDRLHGMVFSAITGTPCIALANYNYKVHGTYQWLKHLPYIKFCDDIRDLKKLAAQIDTSKRYSYEASYYNEYWDKIRDVVKPV